MGRYNYLRVILFVVMVGLIMIGVFGPVGVKRVWACSCHYISPSEAFREADVVFSGHVTNRSRGAVTFEVVDSWKGVNTNRVIVHAISDPNYCGFSFAVGTTYLVYAYELNGGLSTSLCTRNADVSKPGVEKDFAYLNTLARLTPEFWARTLDMICFGGSGLILLVSAIGYLFIRRRRTAVEMDG